MKDFGLNTAYRKIGGMTLATLVACAAYCLGLSPLLEPPVKPRPPEDEERTTGVLEPSDAEFAEYFPADSWQLNDPFKLKTERGSILFGDYRMGADGEIEVKPVSLVIRSAGTVEKPGRTYILDAPDGAVLRFENGLDLSKNSSGFGKLINGKLIGPVTIESPPTTKDADDAIHIATRGIQIDPASVNTAQAVEMHFGPHRFNGQDLKLSFLDPAQKLKSSGGPQWAFSELEITQVDLVQFFVAGQGVDLFGDSQNAAPVSNAEATPIEIRCQGRFKIDFLTMEASFRDRVEVLRIPPRGQPDSLRCDLLSLTFQSEADSGGRRGFESRFSPNKLIATGRPARLESPSVDVKANCQEIEYQIGPRKIVLKDARRVTLTRGASEFHAPQIEYTLAKEARRLGRLHAKGKGDLTAIDPRYPSRSIRAEWDQELKLEPEGALHRLEMRSGAGLFLAGDQQRFTAREMKLWLEENGVQTVASHPFRSPSKRITRRVGWDEEEIPSPKPKQRTKNAAEAAAFDVRPRRMLAIGSVEADTPELKGSTQRMELIFDYPESEISEGGDSPAAGGGGSKPSPRPSLQSARDEERPEAKYDLVGDFIKVEIESRDQEEPTIREVTVHKNLRFERFDLTDPNAPPVRVSGDQFRLTGGIRGDAEVVIAGAPAEVSAEGISIKGPEIHLQQRKNRVYIEQPGNLEINDFTGSLSIDSGDGRSEKLSQAAAPKHIKVSWQGRMDFDGKKVTFTDGVVTDLLLADREGIENEVEIHSGSLEIHLNRAVSLGNRPNLGSDAEDEPLGLDRLVFDGGVDVTNDAFDQNDRRTAFDQLHSRNLSYDHLSGGFKADGPGYVSSVRKGMQGGAGALGFASGKPASGKPAASGNKSGLTYIRVDFDGAITGNLLNRDLTFERRVKAVYSPVSRWDDIVDSNRRGGLGEQGVALHSEELSLFQVGSSKEGEANFEFEARGNVIVEGTKFTAYGARTSYAPAKQTVMLQGDARKDCEIRMLDERGYEVGKQTAGRMTYQLGKKAAVIDRLGNGQFRETPEMGIPATGGSAGGSAPGGKPGAKPPAAASKPAILRPGQR